MTAGRTALVLGAGGQAKVVISTLQELGWRVLAALDDDPGAWGRKILGVPVAGPLASAPERRADGALIAIGSNEARQRIAARIPLDWLTLVHPRAWVHPSVALGRGTVVFAGAVVQPDCFVGEHVILNTGATVDHDCQVGDFVHVAPGAHVAGTVSLGEGVFLGIGSAVVPSVSIGAWSVVGAGATVIRDVPERLVVAGVPARPIQEAP